MHLEAPCRKSHLWVSRMFIQASLLLCAACTNIYNAYIHNRSIAHNFPGNLPARRSLIYFPSKGIIEFGSSPVENLNTATGAKVLVGFDKHHVWKGDSLRSGGFFLLIHCFIMFENPPPTQKKITDQVKSDTRHNLGIHHRAVPATPWVGCHLMAATYHFSP